MIFLALGVFSVWALSQVSNISSLWPRLQIDVPEQFDPQSPLPASVTIRNGLIPLKEVSFFVRICAATDSTGNGKITGIQKCTGPSQGGGGITMPAWQGHRLTTDEKWDILLGSSVPFLFNTGEADVRLVVKYWPQYVPQMWFALRETEARLTTRKKPDGQTIWFAQPID